MLDPAEHKEGSPTLRGTKSPAAEPKPDATGLHAGEPHPEGYISEEEQKGIEVFVEEATTGLDMELGSLAQGRGTLQVEPEQAAAAQGGSTTQGFSIIIG